MGTKVTIHFEKDRKDRATYIQETIGYGKVVKIGTGYDDMGRYYSKHITETGVLIVKNKVDAIVTAFIMRPNQLVNLYNQFEWGQIPNWLYNRVVSNLRLGYTRNQPGYY